MNARPISQHQSERGSHMLDRTKTEAVINRVAVAAFTYYPTKQVDEPGYVIDEDLDWCVAPLWALPGAERDAIREEVRKLIEDPTRDRQAFIRDLTARAE